MGGAKVSILKSIGADAGRCPGPPCRCFSSYLSHFDVALPLALGSCATAAKMARAWSSSLLLGRLANF